jgi:hypothetical protein
MRVLPCIRLSVLDDAGTSPERQLDEIQTFARLGNHELVPITEADYDLDASGSVSPFERPGLVPGCERTGSTCGTRSVPRSSTGSPGHCSTS